MRKSKNTQAKKRNRGIFALFARKAACWSGLPQTFLLACSIVLIWGISGPLFGFSDTWQLVINTGTTIITFLMVFLIQNSQNRDTQALQLKLDELIRVTKGAHLILLDLEELNDKELGAVHDKYIALAAKARRDLRAHHPDTNNPVIRL